MSLFISLLSKFQCLARLWNRSEKENGQEWLCQEFKNLNKLRTVTWVHYLDIGHYKEYKSNSCNSLNTCTLSLNQDIGPILDDKLKQKFLKS